MTASSQGSGPPASPQGQHRGKIGTWLSSLVGSDNRDETRYLTYLLLVALAGWALASYDFNLLVSALPVIASSLHLSQTEVGLLAFLVYAAMLVLSLAVGYCMDRFGRKVMWQVALVGAAVFTGLTFFVHAFWSLVLVRALASGLSNSELAISITLVNEQVPAGRRGLLYSIVQGGWPVGVLLASAVFALFHNGFGLDWHVIFLFGVIPLLFVIVARRWVRPSERYQQLRAIKDAKKRGDQARVDELLRQHQVDVDELEDVTVRQLFASPGWVRRQLIRTSLVWLAYAAGFVAANTYIVDWLVQYRGFSTGTALTVLLVASGVGIAFDVLGGALGERFGRQRVLVASALCTLALTAGFYFARASWLIWVLYVLLYQASNGTWSGVGYAYWAASFPTRVRGTAVGWLGAMFAGGLIIGSGVWTVLVSAEGAVTFLIVGAGFAVLQVAGTFLLPQIKPGQELEDIAT